MQISILEGEQSYIRSVCGDLIQHQHITHNFISKNNKFQQEFKQPANKRYPTICSKQASKSELQ